MLLQFTVENFRSFHREAVLSLLTPEEMAPSKGCALAEGPGGRHVLPCAAIYGANASGKSNMVTALRTARSIIRKGTRAGQQIPVTPFRLDPVAQKAPTRFAFEVYLGKVLHSYGFTTTRTEVREEYLYTDDGSGERMVFEREADEKGAARFRWGEGFAEGTQDRAFIELVARGTRNNQLFLTEAEDRNIPVVGPMMKWLRSGLGIIGTDAEVTGYAGLLERGNGLRDFVSRQLAGADTGIREIFTLRESFDPHSLVQQLTPEAAQRVMDELKTGTSRLVPDGQAIDIENAERIVLQLRHQGTAGEATFDLRDESDGTRRLLHLSPALFFAAHDELDPEVFVVDEIERSLHPLLTRRFVQDFLTSCTKPGSACSQLIFTTHDTNLLQRDVLPPECVWFVQKDPVGASTLYALSEFKREQLDRLTDRLEEGYLMGRFGAIPFLADRERLGWNSPPDKADDDAKDKAP